MPETKKEQPADKTNAPTRQSHEAAQINESVRTVEVPIEHTGAEESIVLNRYNDPNYGFSVTFPQGYSYNISESAVLFTSRERGMRFSAEVIYTLNNGGLFSDEEDVKEDYLGQLADFSPEVLSSSYRTINSNKMLVFDVKYSIPGRGSYVNSFVIGSGDDYFYVLQFMTPEAEFDTEKVLIKEISDDFNISA